MALFVLLSCGDHECECLLVAMTNAFAFLLKFQHVTWNVLTYNEIGINTS